MTFLFVNQFRDREERLFSRSRHDYDSDDDRGGGGGGRRGSDSRMSIRNIDRYYITPTEQE